MTNSVDVNSNHTVLVVDDQETVLLILKRQLASLPYLVIPTRSPAEAIHILKTREISLLLCDLNMPDIHGNAVLSAAREANPNIVSIVLTGAMDPTATIKAINEGGIWKYLTKPWKPEELVTLIHDGIKRYSTLRRQQMQLEKLARRITAKQPVLVKPSRTQHKMQTAEANTSRVRIKRKKTSANEPALPTQSLTNSDGLLGGRYKLLDVIGEGGAGTVYKAEDILLGMPVAVKVLGSELTHDEKAIATLKAEARIAMQLSHKHIVRLHNLQKERENYFLVMEYVEGRTFFDIIARYGKLPPATVRQTIQVCADALSYAHRHKVVHRDLKPANLLLSKDGVLKIIDFGIACLIHAQEDDDYITGTPAYMSPEQILGKPLDARTDVYSLGIIAFELLTGHVPFSEHANDLALYAKGPQSLDGLPGDIRGIIEKAVAPQRENRWPSVEDFARALMDSTAPKQPPDNTGSPSASR